MVILPTTSKPPTAPSCAHRATPSSSRPRCAARRCAITSSSATRRSCPERYRRFPIVHSVVFENNRHLSLLENDGSDWVVSRLSEGWSIYTNDGRGRFELTDFIPARHDGSCALLADLDNDRDLDLALIDEIADEIIIAGNGE